jgi:hypothetical protein
MTTPELRAFHIGIVVKSLDATMKEYGAMFDVKRWHRAKGRFNGLEMAYGRGGDQAFELFEVVGPGDSHIHQFFEEHGEGVNHIGFWTADVPGSARRAVDNGAQLLSLTADAEGNATARLVPAQSVTADDWSSQGLVTFVKPSGGLLIEYVGPAGEEFMRNWLQDDFENVIAVPPWVG